jgi:hypothetical protein
MEKAGGVCSQSKAGEMNALSNNEMQLTRRTEADRVPRWRSSFEGHLAADLGVVLALTKHENEKDVGTTAPSRSGAREMRCVGQGPCRAVHFDSSTQQSFLGSHAGC